MEYFVNVQIHRFTFVSPSFTELYSATKSALDLSRVGVGDIISIFLPLGKMRGTIRKEGRKCFI